MLRPHVEYILCLSSETILDIFVGIIDAHEWAVMKWNG